MVESDVPHLRLVREPEPLASYIRPFSRDYRRTAELLAEGKAVGTGLIIDACQHPRTDDLVQAARDESLEVVLDPRSVELALPGGRTTAVLELPWARDSIEGPESYSDSRIREYTELVAERTMELRASGVLAPTHFMEAFPSPWFTVDLRLTAALRSALDAVSGGSVSLYYPLVSSLSVLRHEGLRNAIFERLRELWEDSTIDSLWLRVHGFGTTSAGPLNLKRYIDLARSAHQVGAPIVAERSGTVGLALLAFGTVRGIESGISFGDRYDVAGWKKPRSGTGFLPAPRVYLPDLGICLKRRQAEALLASRSLRNWVTCQGDCCPRGAADMIADPRRHFLVTRSREVEHLARVPVEARSDYYLERWLRPASDRATKAARIDISLQRQRERLDQWRTTLSEVRERDRTARPSVSPTWRQSDRRGLGVHPRTRPRD